MGSVGTILQAPNMHRIARAQYEQAVAEQKANNMREKATTTLAEFSRTLGNQMRLEAAGKEYNAATERLSHELEQSGKGRVNAQLQTAEARGALQAQAGVYGVGGSSIELMDTLISLQNETKLEEQSRAVELMASQGKKQTATILTNAQNSIDLQQTIGSFDYQKFVAPKPMKRRLGKLIGVAVATFFGGPMAGEAVADFAVGEWRASNADYGGANQAFGSGMAKAGTAYQQWGQRGGQSWAGAVRQGNTARNTQVTTSAASQQLGNNYDFFNTSSSDTSGFGGWGWGGY